MKDQGNNVPCSEYNSYLN